MSGVITLLLAIIPAFIVGFPIIFFMSMFMGGGGSNDGGSSGFFSWLDN